MFLQYNSSFDTASMSTIAYIPSSDDFLLFLLPPFSALLFDFGVRTSLASGFFLNLGDAVTAGDLAAEDFAVAALPFADF